MEAIALLDWTLETLEEKYAYWKVVGEKQVVKRHDVSQVLYRIKL